VDPNQLAAHNIGIDEVQTAIAAAIPTCPRAGWTAPSRRSPSNRAAACSTAPQYRPIIVAWRNGVPVRLDQWPTSLDGVETTS
jgi:hydrophobic/amphiphilic exporter-1 (mainly G- bacteria), HAE1 family